MSCVWALVNGGGVLVAVCRLWWWWALVGGIGWWSPLMVLVGACRRLLVVVVRAHGVVVAVRGCSWLVSEGGGGLFVGGGVGLLIACDRLVAGVLLSVWSWSWLEPSLLGWGAWLVTWRCWVWGQVGCCRG